MTRILNRIQHSLVFKLIMITGVVCLVAISIWAYFSIEYQRKKFINDTTDIADRISKTIRLGTHYSMMLNSRDDINQIIRNTANQKGILNVRITNKAGYIKFSNIPSEVDQKQDLESEACVLCHRQSPPLVDLTLDQRKRLFTTEQNEKLLGIITPIYNEPNCSSQCHFHDPENKVLGALDVVISLKETEAEIIKYEQSIFLLAVVIIIIPSLFIFIFVYQFVIKPVKELTEETKHIASDNGFNPIKTDPHSEIGRLNTAFSNMAQKIRDNQIELTKQKNEYQTLFENVPCLITVQNRDFQLINFNREFYDKYSPGSGDYCFQAYKGRTKKCDNCPVERTFLDEKSHYSEESGEGKNGTMEYWLARTSPIRNAAGEVVAAMEISLDITERKKLEQRAEQSEKKYQVIFNNIPNPIFVLDYDTLKIINCNSSVFQVYGYQESELQGKKFTTLFADADENPSIVSLPVSAIPSGRPSDIDENPEKKENEKAYSNENRNKKYKYNDEQIRESTILNTVRHVKSNGQIFYVDIWISPSEYPGQKVLLVTTSDITERLETETQFNQAAKLATLGEMATGVAHELNQPLSVIKTSSSFCISKISKKQDIKQDILNRLLQKIDSNVDRASRIIVHMRDFARKSEINVERTSVKRIVISALEIFSQQLKVRGIDVVCQIPDDLPDAMADPGRLEQVFINLLLNARDAIEEKSSRNNNDSEKSIFIRGFEENGKIYLEIEDTGTGIPDDVAEKIFQPFFTTKEVGKGTGLGLSISYGIIKDCKGIIKLKQSSGSGTIFQIILPSAQEVI
ncbi:Sensory box histidine kinase and response regulator protein [Desulfamplus magnetovallimortis]|uniref:histidine kinase n=1 Tax=Desulfamplus magnetovallimortis TaxID=1246637 RepID=A0A1W1H6Q9_9BACT|nr:PAS domain-containing sensor histidine kinase [Desulfamplus magnetovallimortis]SLM28058.1 Sensory box histidine kinase and response regulator protein [Desulfamplus magnetovallimortis]